MSGKVKDRWLERQEEALATATTGASDAEGSDTPQARLLQAARSGRFEALVAQASPAEPVRMVTPEEREKTLREAGQWPADEPTPPETPLEETPAQETPAPEPVREPTPNEAYIAEHCRWVPVRERERRRATVPYGRALTEYDPVTGEIIGDGYIHYDEDDE
jgi:hypothetical protein